MKLTMFQVDAFAEKRFEGNPAAVCPLEAWLDHALLQAIAEENNLSETAFFVQSGDDFELRWFTPMEEVDLCGHATLASAHVLFHHLGYSRPEIHFLTRSGTLTVSKGRQGLAMNFPAAPIKEVETPAPLLAGLGRVPKRVMAAFDYVAIYDSEKEIQELKPDFTILQEVGRRGVVVTAPGDQVNFVCRCFYPKLGVKEDPVTGSAFCELAPYWSEKQGKTFLQVRQLSRRGGSAECDVKGDRVIIQGRSIDFMRAEITL